MEKLLIMSLLGVMMSTVGCAQTSDIDAVKETITKFSKAGDKSDAKELEKYLDDNYRIVMNRLFGSTEVSIMPKSVYLEKIRTKEFGGDDRKLTIENVIVNGSTASAKVTFAGTKSTFVSLTTLIKTEQGQWKLMEEVPVFI